jgi:hypothetical protein
MVSVRMIGPNAVDTLGLIQLLPGRMRLQERVFGQYEMHGQHVAVDALDGADGNN